VREDLGSQLQIAAELDRSNQLVSRFVYGTKPNAPDAGICAGTAQWILGDPLCSMCLVATLRTWTSSA